MQNPPVASAPISEPGFGSNEIARNLDCFMTWYALGHLAPVRRAVVTPTARAAEAAEPELDATA